MKKNVSTASLGDVQAAQNVANREYSKAQRQNYFKAGRDFIAGQNRRKELETMGNMSAQSALDSNLDPTVRSAYLREAQALKLLANQAQYLDPEKYDEAYYRVMQSLEDPRKLANELRRTQMQNEAEILKARIYAGAQGGGRSNKTYEDFLDKAEYILQSESNPSAQQTTNPNIIEQFSNMLNRYSAPSSGQTMTASPYQEQPMLPMGTGVMRTNPSLFQTPDLIGGFSR